MNDTEPHLHHIKAKPSSRYIASRIDGVVLFPLIIAGFFLARPILDVFGIEPELEWWMYLLVFLLGYVLHYFYFVIFEFYGATIGKKIAGIGVVNKNGEMISFKQSLIRNSERFLWLIPVFGQILVFIDYRNIEDIHKRMGDEWAGTYVVKKREAYSQR